MFQMSTCKFSIFFLLFFSLLKASLEVNQITCQKDYFSNIQPETFSCIVDSYLKQVFNDEYFFNKKITNFKYITPQGLRYTETFEILKTLSSLSKNFYRLTFYYVNNGLGKFISREDIFLYGIQQNKPVFVSLVFSPTNSHEHAYYSLQKAIVTNLKWCRFYQQLTSRLSARPSSRAFIQKAPGNAFYYIIQLHYNRLAKRICHCIENNYPANPHKKVVEMYTNLRVSKAEDKNSWFDSYMHEKDTLIQFTSESSIAKETEFIKCTEEEKKKIQEFLKKHTHYVLKNKENIIFIIEKKLQKHMNIAQKEVRAAYLITKYLIVLHSQKDITERHKTILQFLKTLSNYYWDRTL